MVVPTTKRQFYDTTRKISSLAAYAGAIRDGAEAWGKVMDQQQQIKIESQLDTANQNIKNEFQRKSPEYDNNPDNPEFKQYMDEFKKNEYEKARQDINPFYRGQFDTASRQSDKQFEVAFDGWRTQQRTTNASAEVKKLAQSMIDNAYIAGQTGDITMAQDQFNRVVPKIRAISTSTLGARATQQGVEDLNKQYLVSFATGKIEADPYGAEHLINDSKFIEQVGKENAQKLKNFLKSKQNEFKKTYVHQMLAEFNSNPTKQTLDMIKGQDFIKVSDKTLKDMEETYKASPNYICETDEEALSEVMQRVEDFVAKDYIIKEGENKGAADIEKQYEDATELSKFIMLQNSEQGKLSNDDRQKYMSIVAQTLSDTQMKTAMLNTKGAFQNFLDTVNNYNPLYPTKLFNLLYGEKRYVPSSEKTIMSGIIKGSIISAMNRLEEGDEDGARAAFEEGARQIIYFRNPEVRGKKVGDTFSKDGQTYQIMGFDNNDVNVRIIYD